MALNLADLFILQLAQQASLYNITHKYGRRQSAERVERFFYYILETLPVSQTLEIGAHEATFSRIAKSRLKDKIEARAFEANPLVYSHFMLDKEVRNSGIDYFHSAIGDKDGSWLFKIYESTQNAEEPPDSRRHSCLLRADSPNDNYYDISVPIARLDSICSKDCPESVYALWIDAEGFSLQVLEGAEETLHKTAAIYIELESRTHFQGQALDNTIISHLISRDFVPILRDFLFPHQYNAIFVKKSYLPEIEHEWHRFFQGVLRQELSASFNIPIAPQQNIRKKPPRLITQKLENIDELREVMDALPLLRRPRHDINPHDTVVVCHYSQLNDCVERYKAKYSQLPVFYPLDIPGPELALINPEQKKIFSRQVSGSEVRLANFADLTQAMDIHVFFNPHRLPGQTPFACLALGLQAQGIERYSIESESVEKFYLRHCHARYSETQWRDILQFYNALADSKSQYTYLAVCKARTLGEPGYIPLADYPQYEHPLFRASPGDIICEGGCAPVYEPGIGVTSATSHFANIIGKNGIIWAFEPVEETWKELKKDFVSASNINVEAMALWSQSGHLNLRGEGVSAYADHSPEGSCPCVSIDDFFADKAPPDIIKLDVEGAELEVLKGGENIFSASPPKMLISIYHSRPARDWIRIPRYLLEFKQPLAFYCGHHRPWFNETVLYAKPLNQTAVS